MNGSGQGENPPRFLDGAHPAAPLSGVMTPAPPTRARGPEICALTGARGIPVLLIVLFHIHEWYGYSGVSWYDTVASKGYIWVEFFFALSGFILFYAYGARFGAGLRVESIGTFLAARVSRIYPLQLVTLLAVVVLEADRRLVESRRLGVGFLEVPVFAGRTADTFLTNLLMVQAWGFRDVLSWNVPAWFVSVEFFLYLVCPVLILLSGCGRGGGRRCSAWPASCFSSRSWKPPGWAST